MKENEYESPSWSFIDLITESNFLQTGGHDAPIVDDDDEPLA